MMQESKSGQKRLGFQMIHRREKDNRSREEGDRTNNVSREFKIAETGLSSREEKTSKHLLSYQQQPLKNRVKQSVDLRSSGLNASKRDLWKINGFSNS